MNKGGDYTPAKVRTVPMTNLKQIGDLEINQDMNYQNQTWVVQRYGWGVMAGLILSGLLGLLGPGPLSKTKAGDPAQPLWLEYNRFERLQAPTRLQIHLGTRGESNEPIRVWINRPYLDNFQIQQVTPEPESVEVGSDRFVYVFRSASLTQPTIITIHLQPEQPGRMEGQVGLDDRQQPLSFKQFVYP